MNETFMKPGALSWNELMTTDVAAARQFYGAPLGWETDDDPGGSDYVLIKVDGKPVGGMMAAPPDCAGLSLTWGIYVTVADVEAVARQVEGLGGKLLRPPADIPDLGCFCVLQDPRGATLCAITYQKPVAN